MDKTRKLAAYAVVAVTLIMLLFLLPMVDRHNVILQLESESQPQMQARPPLAEYIYCIDGRYYYVEAANFGCSGFGAECIKFMNEDSKMSYVTEMNQINSLHELCTDLAYSTNLKIFL